MTNGAGGIRTEEGIVFATVDGVELKLDVHDPPEGSANGACVIELFGGGFTRGHRGGHYEGVFKRFAPLGYVCVAPEYRHAPDTKWPGQMEDAKAAVRWVQDNAGRLGIDPAKIILAGYSAGALIALDACGDPDLGVAACIAYYPATVSREKDGSDHALLPPGSSDEAYALLQPIDNLRPGYPPTFLICGTRDRFRAPTQALYDRLIELGTPVELHLLAGQDHIFDRYAEFADIATEWCDQFMDRYVVDPREYPAYQRPAPVRA
jgi:acetyl esterase/lipase